MSESNTDRINNLYGFINRQGYLYKNGSSVAITVILFIIFFLINSYLFININTSYYKKNWVEWRCDPSIMPFAGIINAPYGESKFEYTFKNFSFCLNTLLDDIVAFIMAPIVFLIEIVTLVYTAIMLMIDEIVRMFTTYAVLLQPLFIYFRYYYEFLDSVSKIFIKTKVIMKKVHATNVTAVYVS